MNILNPAILIATIIAFAILILGIYAIVYHTYNPCSSICPYESLGHIGMAVGSLFSAVFLGYLISHKPERKK